MVESFFDLKRLTGMGFAVITGSTDRDVISAWDKRFAMMYSNSKKNVLDHAD